MKPSDVKTTRATGKTVETGSKVTLPENEKAARYGRGGWSLAIMATGAIIISIVLTSISLAIYHHSGDIYLDRSRPGYLPDDEEVEEDDDDEEGEYKFEKTGAITKEVLEEYLKKLQVEVDALDEYQNPFGDEALSDSHFGL